MKRYWEEDTETEIGRPFDLEKHDKEISNKWLNKIKEAKEEIQEYSNRASDHKQEIAFKSCLALLDNLIAESEE